MMYQMPYQMMYQMPHQMPYQMISTAISNALHIKCPDHIMCPPHRTSSMYITSPTLYTTNGRVDEGLGARSDHPSMSGSNLTGTRNGHLDIYPPSTRRKGKPPDGRTPVGVFRRPPLGEMVSEPGQGSHSVATGTIHPLEPARMSAGGLRPIGRRLHSQGDRKRKHLPREATPGGGPPPPVARDPRGDWLH